MTIYDLIITKLERQKVKDREVETFRFRRTSIARYVLMIICICLALASMDLRILRINTWWRYDMKTLSTLLVLHVGIHPAVTGGCPTRASGTELWCYLFYVISLNELLNRRAASDLRRHDAHVTRLSCVWMRAYLWPIGEYIAIATVELCMTSCCTGLC